MKRIINFIKAKREAARQRRVAKFMRDQALDLYFYFIRRGKR